MPESVRVVMVLRTRVSVGELGFGTPVSRGPPDGLARAGPQVPALGLLAAVEKKSAGKLSPWR